LTQTSWGIVNARVCYVKTTPEMT